MPHTHTVSGVAAVVSYGRYTRVIVVEGVVEAHFVKPLNRLRRCERERKARQREFLGAENAE